MESEPPRIVQKEVNHIILSQKFKYKTVSKMLMFKLCAFVANSYFMSSLFCVKSKSLYT